MTNAAPNLKLAKNMTTAQTIESGLSTPESIDCDVLIIGAGLAGLSTALSLPKALKVSVLSKKELTACSSHYAQGGIAASLAADDSVKDHITDTLVAGDGLCDSSNTSAILSAGANAIAWLQAQGVPFTLQEQVAVNELDKCTVKDESSSNSLPTIERLHLTQEGGHNRRRVAHVDDATGQYVMQTLSQRVLNASNITVLTGYEALELITKTLPNQKEPLQKPTSQYPSSACQGALVFDSARQRLLTINSRAVVLASGGLGQLFKRATAPEVCMGDGMMMAWQAGCRLANLEFVQFHPTGLALENSNFLISEALRGEGAYLRCPINGERFMHNYDSRLELAPRDIVARAIAEQIKQNGLGFVHLDISHQPSEFVREHFPKIAATLDALGIDMTKDPIPVAPTAHYSCGGVVTSAQGLTDVAGLYAVGEVAYTGLHGANRLASNSLLECVVVGRRIAQHLPYYLGSSVNKQNHGQDNRRRNNKANLWSVPKVANGYLVKNIELPQSQRLEPAMPSSATQVDALKSLMSQNLGISRNAKDLLQAMQQIDAWQRAILLESKATPSGLALANTTNGSLPEALDTWRWQRLLYLARLMLQAALSRSESRGGHFRSDYPSSANAAQVSVIASPKAATNLTPKEPETPSSESTLML